MEFDPEYLEFVEGTGSKDEGEGTVTIFNAGTCNFYGGSVSGGKTNSLVGTVTTTEDSYTYDETSEELTDHGQCVWTTAAGQVTLGGNVRVEHLRFADDDGLTATGQFTGLAEIEYNTLTELTDLTAAMALGGLTHGVKNIEIE